MGIDCEIDNWVSPVPGGMSITRTSSSSHATCRKSFSTADMIYNLHISKERLKTGPLPNNGIYENSLA